MARRGALITFEGAEGSGKSTQISRAKRFLRQRGLMVLHLREPGSTPVSEAIRKILLDKRLKSMTANTELLLYLAARAQIVEEKIKPAIKKGYVVICDRYEDSTLAYQGYGRGLSLKQIDQVSREWVRGSLKPKRTLLLDIDPQKGMKRGGRRDRIERASMAFHRRVRLGFLKLAKANRRRYIVIDATQSQAVVWNKIKDVLARDF